MEISNVQLTGENASNYILSENDVKIKIVANSYEIVRGEDLPNLTYTIIGLPEGTELDQEPTLRYESNPDSMVDGTYTILVEGAQLQLNNKDCLFEYESGTLIIKSGYQVIFEENMESQVSDLTDVAHGTTIAAPSFTTEKEHYTFDGWYTEATFENQWNFQTDEVEGTLTLYAKWSPIEVSSVEIDEQLELYGGDTHTLVAIVVPTDALDPSIQWSVELLPEAIAVGATEYPISVDQDGKITANAQGSAYVVATSTNGISDRCLVTVTKKANQVTFKDAEETFTYAENISFETVITSGATVSYEYKVAGQADSTYDEKVPTNVGSYVVRASVAESDTYYSAEATHEFSITQAESQIVMIDIQNITFGNHIKVEATVIGVNGEIPSGTVIFYHDGEEIGSGTVNQTINNGVASYTIQNPEADEYSITAEFVSTDTNYKGSSTTTPVIFTVEKATQTINLVDVGNKNYGEESFDLSITGQKGTGAVTDEVVAGDAIIVNDDVATIVGVGSVTVKATVAADQNYNEASDTLEIEVGKAKVDIVFPTASGVEEGNTLAWSELSGGSIEFGSFTWADVTIIPQINNNGYEVVFTPSAEMMEYYELECSVTKVTVEVEQKEEAEAEESETEEPEAEPEAEEAEVVSDTSDATNAPLYYTLLVLTFSGVVVIVIKKMKVSAK